MDHLKRNGHLTTNGYIQGDGKTFMPRRLEKISFPDSMDMVIRTKTLAGYGPLLDTVLDAAEEQFSAKYLEMA